MKAKRTTPRDMASVGPPYLHLAAEGTAAGLVRTITEIDENILVRSLDADRARNLKGLCGEIGRGIDGRPIADNADALDDVMGDPGWVAGSRYPAATVYIVENAENMLRDIALGLAAWGTMADHWANVWAQPVKDGAIWDRDPIPLHFIHIAKRLPKDAPQMSRFETEAAR